MSFVPVILVLASLGQPMTEPTDYKTAYQRAMKGDKPLLVLVTAEWCPPCQRMKQSTIPQMMKSDSLEGFYFATVDLDKDPKNAKNLIGDGKVPQLILFEKKNGEWKTRSMIGFGSPDLVRSFLGTNAPVRTAEAVTEVIGQ